jgi:uncharacterized protein
VRLARPETAGTRTPRRAVDTGGSPTDSRGGGETSVTWEPVHDRLSSRELEAAGPFDAIVNLAGAGIGDRRWTPARRRAIIESRVRGTELLVQHLGAAGDPKVLVNASAVGIYGDRGDEQLDEGSAPGHGFLADLCRRWEDAASRARSRTRVVMLRSGVVLSAKGGLLGRMLPFFRWGLGGRLGPGTQWVSWISLPDEVAIVCRALADDQLEGPVNATAPEPVTNARFTAAIARALRRPAILNVPSPALRVALGAEMARELTLASQRALPARLQDIDHRFAHPTVQLAMTALMAG